MLWHTGPLHTTNVSVNPTSRPWYGMVEAHRSVTAGHGLVTTGRPVRGHGRSRPVTSLRVASRPSRPSRLQVTGPAAHSSPRWSRSATTRLLARPTLRSLCAARVATPARAVLRRLAFGRVAAHVTSPRPRGRVDDPKRPKANTAPLPGSVCHAACGARIVPWRQPGDRAVNFRSPLLSQSARARLHGQCT